MNPTINAAGSDGGFSFRKMMSLMSQLNPFAEPGEESASGVRPESGDRSDTPAPPAGDGGNGSAPGVATASKHGASADVESLRREFQELVRRVGRAGDELAEQVALGGTPSAPATTIDFPAFSADFTGRMRDLGERLNRIESGLSTRPQLPSGALDPILNVCRQMALDLKQGLDRHQASFERGQANLQAGLNRVVEQTVSTPTPAVAAAPPAGVLGVALFGDVLSADGSLTERIAGVCRKLLAGDAAASTFVGQMLVYRHAAPERRPQLLKDIGEAYYRCFPKLDDTEDSFEQALVSWCQKTCEQAGFQNRIEPVHPGERFDATRHTALERGGVEVVQAHGWVVLRDPDKVYTKALVSVR